MRSTFNKSSILNNNMSDQNQSLRGRVAGREKKNSISNIPNLNPNSNINGGGPGPLPGGSSSDITDSNVNDINADSNQNQQNDNNIDDNNPNEQSGGSSSSTASGTIQNSIQNQDTNNDESDELKLYGPKLTVLVRKRPMNKKEREAGNKDNVVQCLNDEAVVREPKLKVDLTPFVEEHHFRYDRTYSEQSTNNEIYIESVRPLVRSIFNNSSDNIVNNNKTRIHSGPSKCTVLAYGQTGSGKTFTMMGPGQRSSDENGRRYFEDLDLENGVGWKVKKGEGNGNASPSGPPKGIFLLAAEDIFSMLEGKGISGSTTQQNNTDYSNLGVIISFYEIYCGKLFDLLNRRHLLHARENAKSKVCIVGLTETRVRNVNEVMDVIEFGLQSRTTSITGANVDSSRSHAILQITLKDLSNNNHLSENNSYATQHDEHTFHGRISFIDLAGSERGANTMSQDRQTRLDGAEINKSLLALKECIRSLDQELPHTPFRGSKLTQVLKDSLVGSSSGGHGVCRTVMIATVSPSANTVEHTLNTLRYAYRVKELQGRPQILNQAANQGVNNNNNGYNNSSNLNQQNSSNINSGGPPINVVSNPVNSQNMNVNQMLQQQRESQSKSQSINFGSAFGGQGSQNMAINRAERERIAQQQQQQQQQSNQSQNQQQNQNNSTTTNYSPPSRISEPQKTTQSQSQTQNANEVGSHFGGSNSPSKVKSESGNNVGSTAANSTGSINSNLIKTQQQQSSIMITGPGGRSSSTTSKSQSTSVTSQSTNTQSQQGPTGTTNSISTTTNPNLVIQNNKSSTFSSSCTTSTTATSSAAEDSSAHGSATNSATASASSTKDTVAGGNNAETVNTVNTPTVISQQTQSVTGTAKATSGTVTGTTPSNIATNATTPNSGLELNELVRRHDQLISLILQEEEELISAHRSHVDSIVDLVKDEMSLIQLVDRPGSDVDSYVAGLDHILSQKMKYISEIKDRVNRFQNHLKEEDLLSKAFQERKMGLTQGKY